MGPPFLLVVNMAISTEMDSIILNVLERYGCELVLGTFHREKNGQMLRLLIERSGADPDKGSGVDLSLCSAISRDISAVLDVEDFIDKKYTLEVSSPGIERPLVRSRDFIRFAGKPVAVKTKRAIKGRRRFKGMLNGLMDGMVKITTRDGQTVTIPGELVEKANLVFEPNGLGANVGDR